MKQTNPPMGMNRTGIQMAPADINDLIEAVESTPPSPPGDEGMMQQFRRDYAAQSDRIGSVPPAGAMKDMAKSGTPVATKEPQLLLDKLGERLAFERTSVRLYDGLIAKVESAAGDANVIARDMTADALMHIRNEEAEHFALVSSAIEQLAGDPTAQTPCADLAGVESQGLMQVINDPRTTVAQSLHAILTGELSDNAGWETLIALAQEHGHQEMARDFDSALQHEREHLQRVRGWLEEMLGIGGDGARPAGQAGKKGQKMPPPAAKGSTQDAKSKGGV